MTWFKVDDKFHSHPKVMELSTSAVGLWTLAGSWCADYLTDGEIRAGQIRRLGGSEDEAQELVDAGLWEPCEGGYRFRNWHDYQPTREAVEEEREQARERMRRVREQRRSSKDVRTNTAARATNINRSSPSPAPVPVPEVPNGTSVDANAADPATKSRKRPATTLPPDWQPTDTHRQKAHAQGVDLDREAEQFRLHADTNDRRCVNWNSAFTMWLNKAHPQTGPRQRLTGPERQHQISAERHERITQGQFGPRPEIENDPALWMPRQIEET